MAGARGCVRTPPPDPRMPGGSKQASSQGTPFNTHLLIHIIAPPYCFSALCPRRIHACREGHNRLPVRAVFISTHSCSLTHTPVCSPGCCSAVCRQARTHANTHAPCRLLELLLMQRTFAQRCVPTLEHTCLYIRMLIHTPCLPPQAAGAAADAADAARRRGAGVPGAQLPAHVPGEKI